jgi:hypothetical protein
MKIQKSLFSASFILALSLIGCDGTTVPANLPSALPSKLAQANQPSGTPATAQSNTPAAPAKGEGIIEVIGSDLFNKYKVDYRTGMKWVYTLTMPGFALPSIPTFNAKQIPSNISDLINSVNGGNSSGTGANNPTGNSSGSLGEMTLEVKSVVGELVTIETTINMSISVPGGSPLKPTTVTFNKSAPESMYSKISQSGDTNGTYTYSLIGPENITVAAGSYSADKLAGKLKATTSAAGSSVSTEQDSILWLAPGVGMVKQETKTMSSGIAITNILELKSFTP